MTEIVNKLRTSTKLKCIPKFNFNIYYPRRMRTNPQTPALAQECTGFSGEFIVGLSAQSRAILFVLCA